MNYFRVAHYPAAAAGRAQDMSLGRDDTLRALLPPKTSGYGIEALSEAETAALEAAFGDGFGDVGAVGYVPMPPPAEIRSGLVRHSFYVRNNSEYHHEDYPDEFWHWNDDRPPASDFLPLHFVLRRLRLYFENQQDRFCEHTIQGHPEYASFDLAELREVAAERLYEKPWYEFHALQLIDWIEEYQRKLVRGEEGNLGVRILIAAFSGTLGRLVEQYYWRLRFERAAVTGFGARAGASAGGKIKAKRHQDEQARWRKAAEGIWKERPNLSKTAVAAAIKKRLRDPHTPKHIARFIRRP